MIRTVLVTLGLVIMQAASAQSLNIDLDEGFASPPEGGGAPSSAFGAAAGQAGFWNAVSAVGPRQPLTLRGLDGSLTSVTMLATGGVGSAGGFNFGGNMGDYALLLNDFADISTANMYTFSNLLPGDYVVYTYAVDPVGRVHEIDVDVTSSQDGIQSVLGPMPANTFQQGITHSVHHVHLTGNTFTITLSTQSISPVQGANGFQIVAVPEPGTILASVVGIVTFVGRRRKR